MCDKPRRFISHSQHTIELMGAHAFSSMHRGVKADPAGGEEAWHAAHVTLAELEKTIPTTRVAVRKAKRMRDALAEATTAFTR